MAIWFTVYNVRESLIRKNGSRGLKTETLMKKMRPIGRYLIVLLDSSGW